MGKEGSRAYYGGKMVEVKPFIQKNTIETTGAGDTFCGCVLHYICEHGLENLTEENLFEMLQFGKRGSFNHYNKKRCTSCDAGRKRNCRIIRIMVLTFLKRRIIFRVLNELDK